MWSRFGASRGAFEEVAVETQQVHVVNRLGRVVFCARTTRAAAPRTVRAGASGTNSATGARPGVAVTCRWNTNQRSESYVGAAAGRGVGTTCSRLRRARASLRGSARTMCSRHRCVRGEPTIARPNAAASCSIRSCVADSVLRESAWALFATSSSATVSSRQCSSNDRALSSIALSSSSWNRLNDPPIASICSRDCSMVSTARPTSLSARATRPETIAVRSLRIVSSWAARAPRSRAPLLVLWCLRFFPCFVDLPTRPPVSHACAQTRTARSVDALSSHRRVSQRG